MAKASLELTRYGDFLRNTAPLQQVRDGNCSGFFLLFFFLEGGGSGEGGGGGVCQEINVFFSHFS